MSMLRSVFISAATALVAAPLGLATAEAQTPISFGKTVGGSGFHIPSYVAMSRGLFKAEGLDARIVSLTGKALVTAALSGSVDFGTVGPDDRLQGRATEAACRDAGVPRRRRTCRRAGRA